VVAEAVMPAKMLLLLVAVAAEVRAVRAKRERTAAVEASIVVVVINDLEMTTTTVHPRLPMPNTID